MLTKKENEKHDISLKISFNPYKYPSHYIKPKGTELVNGGLYK